MKTGTRNLAIAGAVALAALLANASAAKSPRAPLPATYVEECGSCHVAFPGRMLDAVSWSAVIAGLDQHFGVDASVDAKTLEPIRAYLASSARSRPTAARDGTPLLRITETRWFSGEHGEVPGRFWAEPNAVKPSDCAACHRSAAEGNYSERSIRLPDEGKAK
jgi:hypothetical protein